jgi:hypothetical protein
LDVGLPHDARHCRPHSPSCAPPHAPAQPPDNRTPPHAKFLCFISSLQRHALVCGENLEGGHIFHPRTVLLCGVCTPCTLFYLGRCVAGDDGLYTHLYSRVHTNKHTHTNTNKRTAQPVKVRGAGSRRIYTVKPCSLESLVKGGLLTPRGRATGPSRAN